MNVSSSGGHDSPMRDPCRGSRWTACWTCCCCQRLSQRLLAFSVFKVFPLPVVKNSNGFGWKETSWVCWVLQRYFVFGEIFWRRIWRSCTPDVSPGRDPLGGMLRPRSSSHLQRKKRVGTFLGIALPSNMAPFWSNLFCWEGTLNQPMGFVGCLKTNFLRVLKGPTCSGRATWNPKIPSVLKINFSKH